MIKVAVIGAGLAGLATAYYLLKSGRVQLTLFDPAGAGGGASGVCSGLLHPYPGLGAKRSFRASYAIDAALEIIEKMGPGISKKGILRLPVSVEQKIQMRNHIKIHGDVEETEEGFWIHSGLTVDIPSYLKRLLDDLQSQGARLEKRAITSLEELDGFDQIVIAAGAGVLQFSQGLHFNCIKGQTLTLEGSPIYSFSALSSGYLAHGGSHFEIGATFEREFTTDRPDLEKAKSLLKAPLNQFAGAAKIIDCKAGIRVSAPGSYLPLVKRLDFRTHLFTGLGSRGLLYHAYFAKYLARGILFDKV